jgi:CDP-diglyceride synthetase
MITKDYIKTFALVAIVLFLTLQKGSGPLLGILVPFFLVYALYNFIRMVRRPDERKRRGIRLAIWFVTIALTLSVQTYWSNASQSDAELALQKILAYKELTGTYPASLKEVGLDDEYLGDKWHLRYTVNKGKPALVYPMPFMPLAMYEYDFEARLWRQNVY